MKNNPFRPLISLLALIIFCLLPGAFGCGGCSGGGASIEGRVASDRAVGSSRAALELGEEDLGILRQELRLQGIQVQLLSVDDDSNPDGWSVVDEAEPDADGSFSFSGISPGTYALRLDQPEFGGAYGIDPTEFTLEGGQTLRLVLPLISNVDFKAPGIDHRSAAHVHSETGVIYGAGESFWALNPDTGTLQALMSGHLFGEGARRVMISEEENTAFLLYPSHLIAIDLSIFDDAPELLDLDDPEVRADLGEEFRFRFLPPNLQEDVYSQLVYNDIPRAFFSADGQTLYANLSTTAFWHPEGHHYGHGFILIIDTTTLEVRRVIQGDILAYHPFVDQLVIQGPTALVLVDASLVRDVANVEYMADLGVAPVPGEPEYIVAGTLIATDDRIVPFLARINAEGEILEEDRARDFLGLGGDPDPGAPSFDRPGEVFMLGPQGYRVRGDGSFESIGVQVSPGPFFIDRVSCNRQRVFDPIHRYEIWFDCDDQGIAIPSMAILSADASNIPISVRINSSSVLIQPERGRILVFGAGMDLSIVHYADPEAVDFPEGQNILVGEEFEPQACSDQEPCPDFKICVGLTETAFSGRCVENPRNPFLNACGGLTGQACEAGQTCVLDNPTNPDSAGICSGIPSREYETEGPECFDDRSCQHGFACNENDRCVPLGCTDDGDCDDGQVCGLYDGVGRVCLPAGPIDFGGYCSTGSDCVSGICINSGLGIDGKVIGVCSQACYQRADCPDQGDCTLGAASVPVCTDRSWLTGFIGAHGSDPKPFCTTDCGESDICTQRGCQTGFQPPVLRPSHPDFPHTCITDNDCTIPGKCMDSPNGEKQCHIPCSRNADCPWEADCMAGICRVASDFFPYEPQPYLCNEGQGCQSNEMCATSHFPLSDSFERFFCFDQDPCFHDDQCPEGFHCEGVCTRGCSPFDDGVTPAVCLSGQQCVFAQSEGWSPFKCLPPVCDCPDTGGLNPYCRLSDGRCSFQQSCTQFACDGTFGPPNPDPEVDETCCAPGNPCGLSPEESCACPPSCSFWSHSHCCDQDDCPTAGTPTTCHGDYQCLHLPGELYGWGCVYNN